MVESIGDPPTPPGDDGECVKCGARLENPARCSVCGAGQYTTRSALLVMLVAIPLMIVSYRALQQSASAASPLESTVGFALATVGPSIFLLGVFMYRRRSGGWL